MPGPLESARVGSGGITAHIGFNMDRQELLKVLGDAKKSTADFFKDIKGKISVDVEEEAIRKALRKYENILLRGLGEIGAKARLAASPLAGVAEQMGIISGGPMYGPQNRPDDWVHQPLRPAHADLRGRKVEADYIRKMRREQDKERFKASMYGPEERPEGWVSPETGIQLARSGAIQRVTATRVMVSANGKFTSRMGDGTTNTFNGGGPDGEYGSYGKGGIIRGTDVFETLKGMVQTGAFIYGVAAAATSVVRTAAGIGAISRGTTLGNSSDPMMRLRGRAMEISGAESLPIIGHLIAAFNDLEGTSRNLNARLQARVSFEDRVIEKAMVSGDPLEVAKQQAIASNREKKRAVDTMMADKNHEGLDEVAQDWWETIQLNKEKVFWAGKQRNSYLQATRGSGTIELLRSQLQPMTADIEKLGLERDVALANAKPFEKDAINERFNSLTKAQQNNMGRAVSVARYNMQTSIGASQYRVNNFGMSLEDEAAFNLTRKVRQNIILAPKEKIKDENGKPIDMDELARIQGLGELRAFKASLMVRGGGIVGQTNMATDLVGDPFGIMPQTLARERAMGIVNKEMGQIGGEGRGGNLTFNGLVGKAMSFAMGGERAKNLDAGYLGANSNDVVTKLIAELSELNINLRKNAILLPN